ncbi:MinD/ParA family ATP-binding protein [Streptomyces sedi]|uniref:Cobalamin biosynthesis protein CobQ n=1 Tax=Streptomyces sedi TaxID=555059 RepID=A0A5C4UQF4_9ACTN|nr:cobalamin biosynthesis protein CobQ [Streptomyces sedi]TNM25840.1 cobalamin biosynthesis protein CobQ [Streptomyces sedi]
MQATRERESGPPSRHADFSASLRQRARSAVPRWGWRGRVHRWTKGRLSPRVSSAERDWNTALRAVQMTFGGPRSIVFVNPKGGTFTTTATLLAGRTFGVHRGGGVVAFDNNETRGTLGERAVRAGHANTARELLSAIDLFRGPTARLGDLGRFTRGQGPAHFDVLASDERPEATGQLGAEAFDQLHELFRRYYRLILIDSGNNVRAPAWLAAARQADLLVITTTVREDAASSALWMADVLERDVLGPGALKQRSVALVCDPAPRPDTVLRRLLLDTFGARCHTAMSMPFEPALVGGGAIDYPRLSSATHAAWLHACAAMASALSPGWEG